ncbi:hypothetical protein D3C85_1937550 [compost metagenome]
MNLRENRAISSPPINTNKVSLTDSHRARPIWISVKIAVVASRSTSCVPWLTCSSSLVII